MAQGKIVALRGNVKGRIQGSVVSRSKKNKGYRDSPPFLLKIRNAPRLPVGLEIDLGRADHRLPVKALEDRLVEPQTPEVLSTTTTLSP